MATLFDFRLRVDSLIQSDETGLSTGEKDGYINQAVGLYSYDRPLIKVVDVAGGGSFDLDLPPDFVEGFSVIRSVEYPAGERRPHLLGPGDYTIYKTALTSKLRLLNHTPRAGETVRITYTTKHKVETVPDSDLDAVCHLAGSLALRALAARFAKTSEPTISADAINYRSKAQEYSQLAQRLLDLYREEIGLSPTSLAQGWGEKLLFHGE